MYSRDILGVKVDLGLDVKGAAGVVEGLLNNEKTGQLVCTTNPEFVIEAQKDPEFRELVNYSSLSVADGVGILAADYYLTKVNSVRSSFGPFRFVSLLGIGFITGLKTIVGGFSNNRVSGVKLCEELFKLSAQKGYSIFLLGGWPRDWKGRRLDIKEDFAQLTAERMRQKYPGTNIIGASSEFYREEADDERTLTYIKNVMKEKKIDSIDILMVAYNQNKQERWISRNSSKIPAKVSIGVGGTFDYLIGHYRQVPVIMTKMGLDWLFRLFTQPFRIKRIFNAFPVFPIKIFLSSFKSKNQ